MNTPIEQLLEELQMEATPEEALELQEKFNDRILDIIIVTMFDNLNDEQKVRFLDLIKEMDSDELDQKIMLFAAEVPGLQEKVDAAIEREVNLIRIAFASE